MVNVRRWLSACTCLLLAGTALGLPARADEAAGYGPHSKRSASALADRTGPLPAGSATVRNLEGGATIATGTIEGWPESGFFFIFDDFVGIDSEIEGWWSINTLSPPPRGWFYGVNATTEVAHAPNVQHISEVSDASIYQYSEWVVGPVAVGEFVLFHNIVTGFYAAFRVDDIYGPKELEALADVTWYLQEDGSPDFSGCCALFADGFESGDTSGWSSAVP